MTVWIAVPVTLCRLHAIIDAGIHWNPVDRLVLWALKESPQPLTQLAAALGLPPRLVSEIAIKLMRFGWVEMQPDTLAFQASLAGQRVLHIEGGLPSLERLEPRSVRVFIEPVERRIFPASEVRLRHKNDVQQIAREHEVRWLAIPQAPAARLQDLGEAAQACLPSDEEFVRLAPERCEAVPRLILATVVGDTVEGLPATAPKKLIEQVIARASAKSTRASVDIVRSHPSAALSSPFNVDIADKDILLDGDAHKQHFGHVVRHARHRVVIHSTFLAAEGFAKLQDDLRAAASNGASIDIIYGANKDERTRQRNARAATEIATLIRNDPALRPRTRMHLQSTQSHAKILVADQGAAEDWIATVGSCNWLSTGYHRVEGSVVLRDGRLVAAVLDELRELCYAAAPRTRIVGELDAIACTLRTKPGARGNAEARLVLGDEHSLMMARARDEAEKRICVGGDRFSHAAEAQTLIPMIAAARGGVPGRVLFSRNVSPVTDEDLLDLELAAQKRGVTLEEVPEGVLHGKFLLWDEDDLVVTSLNWSSANTRRDNPWGEIGVHIRRRGIANHFTSELDAEVDRAAADASQKSSLRHRARRR